MRGFEIGQLYNPSRASWPEATQYNYRQGQHELVLFFNRPSEREIADARRGECEFALVIKPPVILLLFRFGEAIKWSDAPYSLHMVPEEQRSIPASPATTETRALLTVFLVDAATGILRVLRAVSFSPAFTRELHRAIAEQAASEWSQREYDAQLAEIYSLHPTSGDLVRIAAATCKGGK